MQDCAVLLNVECVVNCRRNDASIYDELTIQDADLIGDVDFGADITGMMLYTGRWHTFLINL